MPLNIDECDVDRILARFDSLESSQKDNTASIENLTVEISRLKEDTREVVEVYNDAKTVIKVGSGVQKFLLWLAGLGVGGAALASVINWVLEKGSS